MKNIQFFGIYADEDLDPRICAFDYRSGCGSGSAHARNVKMYPVDIFQLIYKKRKQKSRMKKVKYSLKFLLCIQRKYL
jgi:hypothetical protein